MSLKELVEAIVVQAGSSSQLRFGVIPDRISEAEEWLLDNAKAGRLLKWKPTTPIRVGLQQTIDYFKNKI